MWKLLTFSYRHALLILLATALLIAAGAYMARKLRLEVDFDQLMPKDSTLPNDHDAALQTFGPQHSVAVYVE